MPRIGFKGKSVFTGWFRWQKLRNCRLMYDWDSLLLIYCSGSFCILCSCTECTRPSIREFRTFLIHPSIRTYYSCFVSNSLPIRCSVHSSLLLSLLFKCATYFDSYCTSISLLTVVDRIYLVDRNLLPSSERFQKHEK